MLSILISYIYICMNTYIYICYPSPAFSGLSTDGHQATHIAHSIEVRLQPYVWQSATVHQPLMPNNRAPTLQSPYHVLATKKKKMPGKPLFYPGASVLPSASTLPKRKQLHHGLCPMCLELVKGSYPLEFDCKLHRSEAEACCVSMGEPA